MTSALEIVFWLSVGLIAWTQLGYAAALALLARVLPRARRRAHQSQAAQLPSLSLVIAAHDEESVIAATVAGALALEYPRERLARTRRAGLA